MPGQNISLPIPLMARMFMQSDTIKADSKPDAISTYTFMHTLNEGTLSEEILNDLAKVLVVDDYSGQKR